jgi:3-hydroxyisobutyrate dehydrogenase-like beta-hydroxyacid dehydrogenase
VADKLRAAEAQGVQAAASAAEVARACEQVHVCVMTRDDLAAALFGSDGVAAGGAAGKLLVDHSTTEVGATKAFAEKLRAEAGMGWVDAPNYPGPHAAAARTLANMAGGRAADFDRAEPVLADLGPCMLRGEVGAGQTTKMVNQVLVLNNYCIPAEALALAEAGGVDAAKIPAALGGGYAGSTMLQKLYPRLVARDFAPAGYAFQALKDLDMVHGLAKELQVPTPMSAQAASLFRILNAKGHGDLDGLAVLKLYDPEERL